MEIIYKKISDDKAQIKKNILHTICDGGESWKIKHQHKKNHNIERNNIRNT